MKVFNKVVACLIVASFIFSSEGFAVKRNTNEEKRSLTVKPRLKRAPVKKARANVRRPRKAGIQQRTSGKSAALRKGRPARARKDITNSSAVTRKGRPARAQKNVTPAPTQPVNAPVPSTKVKRAKTVTPPTPREATPGRAQQKSRANAPRRYTIRGTDLPENVKKSLIATGVEEKDLVESYSFTPQELREWLAAFEQNDAKSAQECKNFLKSKYGFEG